MKKILAMILVLVLALATVAVAEEAAVMSFEEFDAAEFETEVTVEAYVQAKQKLNTEYGNTSIYAVAEDGAYFIYRVACDEETYAALEEGTLIRITGKKAEWSGEVEIAEATIEIVETEEGILYEAMDVTELLGTDDLILNMNEFVAFKGMTVAPIADADDNEVAFTYGWGGTGEKGADLYFNVSLNDVIYTFCVESDLCDENSDVYAAVEALQIGDVVDLEGFLYWYNGANPHITSVVAAA